MNEPSRESLTEIYGREAERAKERFRALAARLEEAFGAAGEPAEFFTAPGRTEIIGNHTDHNGGRILAGAVTMDTIAAARRTGDRMIRIVSEGYPEPFVIDADHPENIGPGKGTLPLIAGMLDAAKKAGFRTGGFEAAVSTNVMASAGVSSSASFEMLFCTILSHFFNEGEISCTQCAKIGQYAENVYWQKASGLMDQMACACGGVILLDFSGEVKYDKIDFSFSDRGYDEILIRTGEGHADLSAEYSSIPEEMRLIARALGGANLCEVKEQDLAARLPEIRRKTGNDRAILRAFHFFGECRRVDEAADAAREGRMDDFLRLLTESGRSSLSWLQNGFVADHPEDQPVPLALCMTEQFLKEHGPGACRLHGGGFGGVIMTVLPREMTEAYTEYMAPVFGRENICRTGIRAAGAVKIG